MSGTVPFSRAGNVPAVLANKSKSTASLGLLAFILLLGIASSPQAAPNDVHIDLAGGNDVETGRFYVFDTDGTSLLFMSPLMTVRSGDVWDYQLAY